MQNKLHLETSPYLLQHAKNPVHWQPWNNNSLEIAKQKNKLLVVSIGYSACHWCHVMEHESFEDTTVAKIMNSSFVNIKIDREERPDIDSIYMKAIQIMSNQGGWPLNVVCLPDGRPIWGGTYFRKDDWINSLEQLAEMYSDEPEKMIGYAEKLHKGIQTISLVQANEFGGNLKFDGNILENLVTKWQKSFDLDFGGMAHTPKFMMPNNYAFLMRFAHQTNNAQLLGFVDLTLTKMAYGGLFDTIGGGFSRYSVDEKWHIPHFEKMLYDNAQLLSLYADAFKRTNNKLYQEIAEKTIRFLVRDLLDSSGGFYCALDADSTNDGGELEEGAFYVWKKPDLQKIILTEEYDLFEQVFNVNSFGHWEHGNFVLIQNQSIENIANANDIDTNLLSQMKISWEQMLFIEREKKPKPRLDNKILCAWNGLTIVGLVDSYKAFGSEKYLDLATNCGNFIIEKLWHNQEFLFRIYANNKPHTKAFLEDYTHTISGFIALFEATLDDSWIYKAKKLTDFCIDHFYDEKSGFFAFNSLNEKQFLVTQFETEDNVVASSNSVMAHNLLKLFTIFEIPEYREISEKMLSQIMSNVDYPSAYSNWLLGYLNLSETQKEIAVVGENALEESKKIFSKYLPNIQIVGSTKTSNLPFLQNRFDAQKTLFYVCENKTCGLPSTILD
jgi:uncharacterized protein YyaL (SSP411 family)